MSKNRYEVKNIAGCQIVDTETGETVSIMEGVCKALNQLENLASTMPHLAHILEDDK